MTTTPRALEAANALAASFTDPMASPVSMSGSLPFETMQLQLKQIMEVCKQQNKVLQRHEELHETNSAKVERLVSENKSLNEENRTLHEELARARDTFRAAKESFATQMELRLQQFKMQFSEQLPELLRNADLTAGLASSQMAVHELRNELQSSLKESRDANLTVAATVVDAKLKLFQDVVEKRFEALHSLQNSSRAELFEAVAQLKLSGDLVTHTTLTARVEETAAAVREELFGHISARVEELEKNVQDIRATDYWQNLTDGRLNARIEELEKSVQDIRATDYWQNLTDGRLYARIDDLEAKLEALRANEAALETLRGEVSEQLGKSRDNDLVTVSTLVDARIAVLKTEIAQSSPSKFENDLTALVEKQELAASHISDLQDQLVGLQATQAAGDAKLAQNLQDIHAEMHALHTMDDKINAAAAAAKAHMMIETRTQLSDLTGDLATRRDLEAVREGITAALTMSIRSTEGAFERRMNVVEENMSTVQTLVEAREAAERNIRIEFEGLRTLVDARGTHHDLRINDIAELHEKLATLSAQASRIEYIDASLQVLTTDFKRSGVDGDLRADLESFRSQLAMLRSTVSEIERSLPSARNFVSHADKRTLEASMMSYVDSNLKDISRQIASMDTQRISADSIRAELLSTMDGSTSNSSFRRNIADVQSAVSALREDVARVQDGFIASAGEIKDIELRFDHKMDALASALADFEMSIRKCFTELVASPNVFPHAAISSAVGRLLEKAPADAQDPDV